MAQSQPAVCRLLEYTGDTATVEVRTGEMHFPRVSMPADVLRNEHLEPGMEFVWLMDGPSPEPPPKITRDPSTLKMVKARVDTMSSMSDEDREEAKFKSVPDDVVEAGAKMFCDFFLSLDEASAATADEYVRRYGLVLDSVTVLFEPFDLLKKYRDVIIDRMIVRGRDDASAVREKKRKEKSVTEPPSYTKQYQAMSCWRRIWLRLRLAWASLTQPLPPKQVTKDDELREACLYTLSQKFDDICWLDFYLKIAKIFGVEYEPKLLSRDRFLKNCGRFYDSMASGQPYEKDPCEETCDGRDGSAQSGRGN